MKQIILMLLPWLLVLTGCQYDDTELRKTLEDHSARLEAIDAMRANRINSDIATLRSLAEAVEQADYVVSMTTTEAGYTLTFKSGKTITIQNGTDGEDADAPVVGVKQDTDGIFYWTLDGAWMLDASGAKIPVSASGGSDAVSPQVKSDEAGNWYISYDGGKTWESAGKVDVEPTQGDNIFKGVTTDEENVYFTLADDTVITIPLVNKEYKLQMLFNEKVFAQMAAGQTLSASYTILADPDAKVRIDSFEELDWKVLITQKDSTSGTLSITAPDPMHAGTVIFVLTDDQGGSWSKAVRIEEGGPLSDNPDGPSVPVEPVKVGYMVDAAEGGIVMDYQAESVVIPDEYCSWISVQPGTAKLTLMLQANDTGEPRTAEITFNDVTGLPVLVTITQQAAKPAEPEPDPDPSSGIAAVFSAADGTAVSLENVVVVALTKRGFLVSDGTDAVYVFTDTPPSTAIGDRVNVSGSKTTYAGLPEVEKPQVSVLSSGAAVPYPSLVDVTPGLDTFEASGYSFISLKGTLSKSGSYYNITVPGASRKGSLNAPISPLEADSFVGKTVEVIGYYSGITGSSTKYLNIIAINIFDVSGEGGETPVVSGWMELPAIGTSETISQHFVGKERNYSLSWNSSAMVPNWVAYPLNDGLIGTGSRTNAWGLDPNIPSASQPLLSSSYKNGDQSYSRGHMIASADRWRSGFNQQTFYYTNMAPMIQNGFNGSIWENLEEKARTWAGNCDTLYVVTGTVTDGATGYTYDVSGKRVTVPKAYWKAVLAYDKSGRTGHNGWQACAFYLDHKDYGTSAKISGNYAMSVDALEAKIGLDLFVNLPAAAGETMAADIEKENPVPVTWWGLSTSR